jgi:uncharacterized protein YukE
MTMQGMNLVEIRRIATALDRHATDLNNSMAAIGRLISKPDWQGQDSQAFVSDWRTKHSTLMAQAAQALTDSAGLLRRQADQQETTSHADPSGIPSPPSGPTSPSSGPTDRTTSGYSIGAPAPPTIKWDEDFVWNSATPTPGDYASAAEWRAKAAGSALWPGMEDASATYRHYWDNNGEPFTIDYDNAADEDPSIRSNIEGEIRRTMAAAEELAPGRDSFSMTGPATTIKDNGVYPQTENWQKALGGYQQWSSADVTISGTTATMTITVHAEDYYNFNRGASDIASNTPDDVNGRFAEVGWAKAFPTHGEAVRTVTWELGSNQPTITGPTQGSR